MPTAMARFSSTTGERRELRERVVKLRDACQSVSAALGARA